MRTPGGLVVGILLLTLIAASPKAQGTVLIVTNTRDTGIGSLRNTVAEAVAGDTVEFDIPTSDPGYDSTTGVSTIFLTSGEIVIDKNLNIAAARRNIAISGNHASRIFDVTMGIVAISDLWLINGKAHGAFNVVGAGDPGMGGAILNQGTLTMTRCTIRGNMAVGAGGSGNLSGPGPGGDGQGGAIFNQNSLTLVACTLADNSALGGPGGAVEYFPCYCWGVAMGGMGSGGAIYNAPYSPLWLSNCTITANNARGADARTFTDFYPATHGAAAQGGGIANLGYLTIVHCTVANNAAVGGASSPGHFGTFDGGASSGGGLYCAPDSVTGIRDVILAPNRAVGGAPSGPPAVAGATTGPDMNGTVVSEGHNLLGRSDGTDGFRTDDQLGGTSDDTRLDPMLGDLADNGGPTQTLTLLPGSPAIDQGALPGEDRDQRYFVRAGPPDVGGFEYQGTQPVMLANISTRLRIGTGDNTMVGGFIITGNQPKTVIVRGIGPSLGIAGALADPIIEVHGPSGEVLAQNDNWPNATTSQEIVGSGLSPANHLESALWETLNPGAYSVIVRGKNDSTGIALFEVYDLEQTADSKLGNVSTRGFVEIGDNVMIGGTIIEGSSPRILFRAIGPSLAGFGVPDVLGDPTLELYDANGQVIAVNDNWRDDQEEEIMATGIPPSNDLESAIVKDLLPGSYTAVVRGRNYTAGVALIEVYALN